jgi:hypothetical protein
MLTAIIDIETAPIADVEAYLPDVRPRAGTKDADKQAAQMAEKRQTLLDKAGLDPDLSRIVCVGVDTGHGPVSTILRSEDAERRALLEWWAMIRQARGDYRLIGFNCLDFDIPWLYRRSLYLDVPSIPMTRDKYRHPQIVDLLDVFTEAGRFEKRSQSYYCKRFALDVPCDEIDGSAIAELVARQDWAAVESHNQIDLVKTRRLAERMGLLTGVAV